MKSKLDVGYDGTLYLPLLPMGGEVIYVPLSVEDRVEASFTTSLVASGDEDGIQTVGTWYVDFL